MSILAKNISVTFPNIKALDEVNLQFEDGKIHAVLGANGCGKSTLVKVLTGVYMPDEGAEIQVGDKTYPLIENPAQAREIGIRVVHQEALMIDSLSVAECIALFKGYPVNKIGMIQWGRLHDYCKKLLAFYHIDVEPDALAGDLSASERAMISIAIAMGDDEDAKSAKILILDEADAAIPEDEAEKFLERVRKIAEWGIPVLMITHRLKDVEKIADTVYILNAGKVVYSGRMADISQDFIVKHMLSNKEERIEEKLNIKDLWDTVGKSLHADRDKPVLKLVDVSGRYLKNLSFEVYPGEIIGVAGIADDGINELPLILGGAVNRSAGEFIVDGATLSRKLSPKKVIREGIALVPADRAKQGGVMNRSMLDNLTMPAEQQYWGKKKLAKKAAEAAIKILDVRPESKDLLFGKFSGGNQQKIIVSKWLLMCPKLMVLDDPTYGVDPGARQKIFAAIKDMANHGVGVVVFSTEPEQFEMLCSKVFVLGDGKVQNVLKREDGTLTREHIARLCYA